mgnify:CR=1 FL=1
MKFTWSHNCAKSVQNLLGVKILTQNTPFCNFETVSEVASKYFCQLFEFTDAHRLLWRHILSILSQDEEQITCANFLSALRGENILIRFNQESFVSEINFLFPAPRSDIDDERNKVLLHKSAKITGGKLPNSFTSPKFWHQPSPYGIYLLARLYWVI